MEPNKELQTILIETAVKKLREQKEILEQIQQNTTKSDHLQPQLDAIKNELIQIRKGDLFSQILTQEIKALKTPISNVLKLLKLNTPLAQTTIHHHYIPKLLWITIGLLFLSILLILGWSHCSDKLEHFTMNDSKYRFLQMQEGSTLHAKLNWVDSLYKVRPNMLDSVNDLEEVRNARLEMMREAFEMEKKAKEMLKNANKD